MDEDDLADEIRRAPEEPERSAEAPDPSVAAAPRDAQALVAKRRAQSGVSVPVVLLLALVPIGLAAGVIALLWGTDASDAFVYSKLVDEVMVDPDSFMGRELRVEGQLSEGSVQFVAEPSCEHRFVLNRAGYTMPVRFPRCVVPDTFRDDMPMDVVVQGELQTDGTFLASQVIPRCPSKYEMRERQENGETMPHGAPGETS